MSEFHLVRTIDGFKPATDVDLIAANHYQTGDLIRVKAQKPRNGKHHRKGIVLLKLAFDYWEPETTFLTEGEKAVAAAITKHLEKHSGDTGVIAGQISEVMAHIEAKRLSVIGEPAKSFELFRKEVVKRAGYYEVLHGPGGITKEALSISFGKMKQEDFTNLYKEMFSVCWDMVLSKTFESEADAENAVNQLMDFM